MRQQLSRVPRAGASSQVSGETYPITSKQPSRTMETEKPEKPKRKKISWACNHCNKAHITCDEARPCQRCIQKGLQDSCEDAPRKKKKYLDDVPTSLTSSLHKAEPRTTVAGEETHRPSQHPALDTMIYDFEARNPQLLQATVFQHSASLPNYFNHQSPGMRPMEPAAPSLTGNNINYYREPIDPYYPRRDKNTYQKDIYANGLDRKRPNFASSAADMEYSTLSNILSVHHTNPSSNEEAPNSNIHSPALSPHGGSGTYMNSSSSLVVNSYAAQVFTHGGSAGDGRLPFDNRINQYILGKTPYYHSILLPDVMEQLQSDGMQPNSESALSFSIAIPSENHDSNSLYSVDNPLFKAPEEIYAKISKPFSYTPGYHRLIAYLRKRFPKDMLVKLAKSMAVYRPSFIACTNSLRESDLIFMEQCFQRTLLTYNDFIKISGTPTIVWRRTGEIAYVGEEFCILTGWTKQQLIGSRSMFIVELLDDKSVVEYFELFSKIAFGDFLGATMTECTLLTPKGVRIRAGCIWTLKRDVFGIPMMIIGNFLPIL